MPGLRLRDAYQKMGSKNRTHFFLESMYSHQILMDVVNQIRRILVMVVLYHEEKAMSKRNLVDENALFHATHESDAITCRKWCNKFNSQQLIDAINEIVLYGNGVILWPISSADFVMMQSINQKWCNAFYKIHWQTFNSCWNQPIGNNGAILWGDSSANFQVMQSTIH